MGKKIAVNSKYFTRTQAKGEMAHVKRELAEDKNVTKPENTKHNFGTPDATINSNYLSALEDMPAKTKNTLIDSVLVLPLEQVSALQKEDPKGWRKKIDESIKGMMQEMEQEMGFKPLGYKFHLDEGEKLDDGSVRLNTHAHMLFANVCTKDLTLTKQQNVTKKDEHGKALKDPKKPGKYLYERDENGKVLKQEVKIPMKGRSPLSLHQTRGSNSIWSRQQDIAAKHLKHLGFERGTSKELTKAKHLEKSQHVKRELKKNEQKLEAVMLAQQAAQERLRAIESDFKEKLDEFIEAREKYFTELLQDDLDIDLAMEEQEKVAQTFENLPEEVKPKAILETKTRLDDIGDSFKNTDSLNNAQVLLDRLAENKQKHDAKNNGDKIEAKKDDKIKI